MFKEFLDHKDPIVSGRAHLLEDLTDAVSKHKLSKDEFQELANDLLDLKKIDSLASTIEHKALLEKAFRALLQIASKFA